MMSPETDLPPIHDDLVARLTADARPVRRLWPPAVRLTAWLVLVAEVLAIAMGAGLRDDLAEQLRRPLYLLEVITLLAASTLAAAAALVAAVPGRGGGRRAARLALVLGVLVAGILFGEPASSAVSPTAFIEQGVRCAFWVAMFGLLPGAALFVIVGRAAPLDGRTAGMYAAGAAFLVGAAAVRVACAIDDPLHLFMWHMMPVVLWSALVATVGVRWLTRWRRTALSAAR